MSSAGTVTVADLDGTDDAADWITVGHVLDADEVTFLRSLVVAPRARVAGEGGWHLPIKRYSGRRAHYFNTGDERSVCGSPVSMKASRKQAAVFNEEEELVQGENPDHWRAACGLCVSIVVHGVDLRAEHAFREAQE